MTNPKRDDSDFKNIEKVVIKALEKYQKNSKELKSSDDKVQSSFLELGEQLVNASDKLTRKTFKQLKENTAKELGTNGIRNIDKVVSVAKATHLKKYSDRLPSSWGTLAVLTSLKSEKLDEFMLDTTITKEITRTELIKKVKKFKNPNVVVKEKFLFIKPLENKDITEEDKSIIKTLLENSGWCLHEPKTKTSNAQEEQVSNEPDA